MKNLFLKLAFLIFIISVAQVSLNAQVNQREKPRFGIKGGVNYANFDTEDAKTNKYIVGFNFGLYTKLPVARYFVIQPELYYSTKGSEVTYQNPSTNPLLDGTVRFGLNYVELPILLVVNITDNLNILLGPYGSFLVTSTVENKANENPNGFDYNANIKSEDFNRFDGGVIGGLDLEFKAITVGARYSYGFRTIGKEKSIGGVNYTIPNATNGVINVYLAFSVH